MPFPPYPVDGDQWVEADRHYQYDASTPGWHLTGVAADHRDFNNNRILNLGDPVDAADATHKGYVDAAIDILTAQLAGKVSKGGDAMTGMLQVTTGAGFSLVVNNTSTSGTAEGLIILNENKGVTFGANFGRIYKRTAMGLVINKGSGNHPLQIEDYNESNRRPILDSSSGVLKAGDVMAGELDMRGWPLKGLGNPFWPDEAASKGYVDSVPRTGDRFIATWIPLYNSPDLNDYATRAQAGDYFTAITADPAVPDPVAPPGIPGIPPGAMVENGMRFIWSADQRIYNWIRVTPGGITEAQADARYLRLVGGGQLQGTLQFLNSNQGHVWVTTGCAIYELLGAGLVLRRGLGQTELWSEDSTGASRQAVLTETTGLRRGGDVMSGNLSFSTEAWGINFSLGARIYAQGPWLILRTSFGDSLVREDYDGGIASRREILDELTGVRKAGDTLQGNLTFANDRQGINWASGARIYTDIAWTVLRTGFGDTLVREDFDGSGRRDIIDTRNGDARYMLRSEGEQLAQELEALAERVAALEAEAP